MSEPSDLERTCRRCGDTVVKRGWFWVRTEEASTRMATYCTPEDSLHDVDEDDDDL